MTFLAHLPLTLPGGDGPRFVDVDDDVEVSFVRLVRRALRLTRNAKIWPTSYGRMHPEIVLEQGSSVFCRAFLIRRESPVRMANNRTQVVFGTGILNMGIFPGLREAGITDEQAMVMLMGHEAYHVNEMQRRQRCRVSWEAVLSPLDFSGAVHPEFSDIVIEAIRQMCVLPTSRLSDQMRMRRIQSKVVEGAADVHSMMAVQRIYPQDALRIGTALHQERDRAFRWARRMGDPTNAYDNADCILRLLNTPTTAWPQDSRTCATFAWRHALPFLEMSRAMKEHHGLLHQLRRHLTEHPSSPILPDRIDLAQLRAEHHETIKLMRHRTPRV